MEQIVATVSELNGFIKKTFMANSVFSDIWIKGEISNFKKHFSGHLYMTLKDEGGVLKAVMFKSSTSSLNFTPSDGMKVMARGRVSVYEAAGTYQLYINEMVLDGVGELYIAYEKLKEKLSKEGLFLEEHKKPVCKYPDCVGVVTASTGAAVKDIINVLTRRFPYAKIIVYPAQVQGVGASQSICRGIRYFNEKNLCDTIIVGRGGGSIEDLWAFNEENVAYEIYNSKIPVISAVGHEVDFTIADFVADLRAPTPSAAAEMAAVSKTEINSKITDCQYSIKTSVLALLKRKRLKLDAIKLLSPKDIIENGFLRLDFATKEIISRSKQVLGIKKDGFQKLIVALDALSPLKVMSRGFSIAMTENKNVIKTVGELDKSEQFTLKLSDGERNCKVIKNKKQVIKNG